MLTIEVREHVKNENTGDSYYSNSKLLGPYDGHFDKQYSTALHKEKEKKRQQKAQGKEFELLNSKEDTRDRVETVQANTWRFGLQGGGVKTRRLKIVFIPHNLDNNNWAAFMN